MYGSLLFAHSWVRWALLGLGVLTLVTTSFGAASERAWSRSDERLAGALLGLADLQLLLGLVLWLFVSPLTELAFSQRLIFKGAPFTFFALVHPVVMLGALFFLHLRRAQLKKQPTPSPHARWRTATLIWLTLVVLVVPWPFWSFDGLRIGRELFRGLP